MPRRRLPILFHPSHLRRIWISALPNFLPVNASDEEFLVDPHLKTPYTYQYNFSVQHTLAPNTVMEVSYVGSSSHGLTSLIDVNPFILGTTNRVLNLGAGDTTCADAGFASPK